MTYYDGKDLARSFRTVRGNTIQIASEIPEKQYGFSVTPETRTVAQTLAHVAANAVWQHRAHAVDRLTFMSLEQYGAYAKQAAAFEAGLTSKGDLINALEIEGDRWASWLESLDEATLGERVGFPPPLQPSSKSRFEMLLGVKEHEMHHRAQLMVTERLLGIVPHLTRARLARQ